jgi:hypothetical protein
MGGARSRRKGAVWERRVAEIMRDNGHPEARRGVLQSRGAELADVEGTPYWVECKVGARQNPRAALRQAIEDTDGRPVVAVIRDNSPGGGAAAFDWVAMPLEVFLAMDQAVQMAEWEGAVVFGDPPSREAAEAAWEALAVKFDPDGGLHGFTPKDGHWYKGAASVWRDGESWAWVFGKVASGTADTARGAMREAEAAVDQVAVWARLMSAKEAE